MDGRKVIHLDMDCFYAAVEMRERPELAGRPVAVGGGSRRGVVTTCNYEARRFGVRSAMPGFQARELCPDLVFLPVRFDLYRAESVRIRAILHDYTPLVEPLSLDEAYLDVTGHARFAWDIAREIRRRIVGTTSLTASAGIAPNKMLAKIASDWRKPDGQFAILPAQIAEFMETLPVRKLWGVGPRCAEKLARLGVTTCGELRRIAPARLAAEFGRWGAEMHRLAQGLDDRPVEPSRPRKSLSTETTFSTNLAGEAACLDAMGRLWSDLAGELGAKAADRTIRSVFVKVKFADFTRTTIERSGAPVTLDTARELLREGLARSGKAVRLLGVGVRFGGDDDAGQCEFDW